MVGDNHNKNDNNSKNDSGEMRWDFVVDDNNNI